MDRARKILIADDELHICQMLIDMMPGDWDVSVVRDGKELYALMTSCRNWYDLAIVDVHMPHWNGEEAVDMAKVLGSETKVLYMSGDLTVDLPNIIYKPFTMGDLYSAIKEILG